MTIPLMAYDVLKDKIPNFIRLRTRTTIIKNHRRIGALGSKYLTITNHCAKGSIVFDVDADDSLIGRQVMKVMNALYQSSSHWFVYSNFVQHSINKFHDEYFELGFCKKVHESILARNSYRTTADWTTSHLKTYLRELYAKIPKKYFME